jgi:hypothetical protein
MSLARIVIGLLVAAVILASEFAAFWLWGFPGKWMGLVLIFSVVMIGGLIGQVQVMKALRPYWKRHCTGMRWRRRFPKARIPEVREFLDLFVDAFGFRRKRRCCFLPEDKVMEIYRALYLPGGLADDMELETLVMQLNKRYGIDVAGLWREDITLGELFELTRRAT